ncbi:fused response regulator/phosphatase [Mucilaginibacter sp. cycad4]|uniref:PP2C family protein-serine/threonine phosphatase n=1 Tax=Mucilaginibacter sp. cycad4 TaxID=3342096 RepID=UPI002AAAC088|nr:fused response regulator/phosphatase [Mucilaginibacter gossypii]WPV02414.1 fused response regulator/phosphatase [Mucilaginibacter gossypii]
MPKRPKILLVDDSPLILLVIGQALEKEGFVSRKAGNVEEAMMLLKNEIPDLILSDYQMPGTDGFAFRQSLMAVPEYKNIPFMFLTSITDHAHMIAGISLDAIDYIDKDTPIVFIISKINNFLNSIRERHEHTIRELSSAAMALNLYSVPQEIPGINGFEIDFWHKSFENYPGGDFIDVITINNRFAFIILGDVMGKKWGAWFFSFGYLSYIRAAVRLCVSEGDVSTKSIMQKINSVIYHDPVVSEVLSTLSLIRIDPENETLCYTGAGDLPLLYFSSVENKLNRISSSGLLLGISKEGGFDEHLFTMQPGDQLIMITDGLIDKETPAGKKTDLNSFIDELEKYLGKANSFATLKYDGFLDEKAREQIDDCSLIFIQKKVK